MFKLRRGVKFHNGEEFNAECVKFTIERAIGSKLNTLAKLTWPPSFGQEVQVLDPHSVRITTKVPDPIVPSRLAAESLNMMPAKALVEYKEKFVTDRFIGTGPFKFGEYVVGDRVVVEANPNYWGAKPPTQKIVWQVIPDSATRLAALQRGDVDVMLNLPIPLSPNVESDPNLRVYSELSSLTHGILLNLELPQIRPHTEQRADQRQSACVSSVASLRPSVKTAVSYLLSCLFSLDRSVRRPIAPEAWMRWSAPSSCRSPGSAATPWPRSHYDRL